jgi:multicomponent K+:H+ antiporter subunit E
MSKSLLGRVFPAPLASAVLGVTWLMLNQSASVGHLIIAAAMGVGLPLLTQRFRPDRPRAGAWAVAARLGGVVLYDIVMSNITVARLVLGPTSRIRSGWVWVPLDIRDPHGIVALAGIITLTPGTLSAQLTDDRRHLLVHALQLDDEAELVRQIKQRYEDPLRRILE